MFSAENISFQNRYKLIDLIDGVDDGDSVAMRQLRPLVQDIQSLTSGMANYVQNSAFSGLFGQLRQDSNLQDAAQVQAAIAAALAGMPDAESRLASVAVKVLYQGTRSSLTPAIIAGFGLTPSDSGDIDDASTTCLLLDSPTPGETGLYQLRTNNQIQSLNSALAGSGLGYYTRFYVVDSSREFAITNIDGNNLEVREIPYVDEYTGLGPIEVSNVNKTINLRFSATDFVVNGDGLNLHPALRESILSIPGLSQTIEALQDLVTTLNTTLSNRLTELTGQVTNLTGQVAQQAQNLTGLRSLVEELQTKIEQAFDDFTEILFLSGVPNIRNSSGNWIPAPTSLCEELGGDANKGLYLIKHGRGVPIVPVYAEANTQGDVQSVSSLFHLTAVQSDSFRVGVEKYKPVLLILQAGLNAIGVGRRIVRGRGYGQNGDN